LAKRKPTGREYEIRSVADFLLVPEDARARCLSEFSTWLKVHDPLLTLLGGPGVAKMLPVFTWIDDGVRDLRIKLHTKPEAEAK
jgi:hypothetical protein